MCHCLCFSLYSSGVIPNFSLKMLMKFSAVKKPMFDANSLILMFVRLSRMQACFSRMSRTSSAGVLLVRFRILWKKGTWPMPIALAISSRLI